MDLAQLNKEEQKNKWIGYGTTTIVHTIILLVLWYGVLHQPDPPMAYGGMELSMALGEPDMGGPNDVPVETPSPVDPVPVPETQSEQQVVTQDIEDADVTAEKVEEKKKTEIKKTVEKPVVKPVEKPRVADARALFKKKSDNSAEGGRGDGDKIGNEGDENGDPNGSPDGNGIGNGLGGSGGGTGNTDGMGSYTLVGRSLADRPHVTDNSHETGKVVVGITVDRTGRVIKVQPGIKGTTNLSPVLLEKAKQGAMQAKFSPKPDGPEEQYGTMTFVFRFKQ